MRDGRFGAIDIGTVTTRMLIADVIDGRIVDVDRQHRITNLGAGVDRTNHLTADAMARVIDALTVFLYICNRCAEKDGLHLECSVPVQGCCLLLLAPADGA